MPAIAVLLTTTALLFGAPAASLTASAQTATESIGGVIKQSDDARTPVPGVTITVLSGSTQIGSAVSGPDGAWVVPLPGPGIYRVVLDTATLPAGVSLRDPERASLDNVDIRTGQNKTVLFPLGERIVESAGALTRFLNLAAKGLVYGAIVALAAIGLSLVFGTTNMVNFAHGELVTFGAVVAWLFNASPAGPRMPLLAAVLPTLVLAGLFGYLLEKGLFRPLRRRQVGRVSLIVVSIGLSLLVRHIFLLVIGGAPHTFSQYAVQTAQPFGPVSLPLKDVIILLLSLAVLGGVALMLQHTRLGTSMRAVADNKDLAEASGIDVERVILATWIMGTVLAALGGVFFGITQTIQWDMGFILLLTMFTAVILGGIGTAYGAMVGGLIIGITTEASTFWLPVEFKHVVALGVLIVVLMVRPQGLFGLKERIG
jgi:neutral amino acid transport system permease protein